MTTVFELNEASLPRFLVSVLLRRKPLILSVRPAILQLQGTLNRIAGWAVTRGKANYLVTRHPEFQETWTYPQWLWLHDVLRKIEPWQNECFGFEGIDARDPNYGYAYKLVATMYVYRRYLDAFLLDAECKRWKSGSDTSRFAGLSPDTLALCRAYFGPDAAAGVTAQRLPARLVNLGLMLLATITSTIHVLFRLRPWHGVEPVFLAVDDNRDPRDIHVIDEVADGGPVLLISRVHSASRQGDEKTARHLQCRRTDGVFGIGEALGALAGITRDGWALYRRHGGRSPALYYAIATMPHKRILARGMFNRFPPKFFWSRDEYNVEHVLRRQELTLAGGKSIGFCHAMQGLSILMPTLRYVSHDLFYIMGDAIYHNYYRQTWAPDMTVKSVGSIGFSRDRIQTPRNPGNDILVMTRYAVGDPRYIEIIRAIAEAFPDRRLLLQIKQVTPRKGAVEDFVRACSKERPNVERTTDNIYDLLWTARVAISDVSTVVSEAIQIGLPTFVADVLPCHSSMIYREFPGLCLKTTEQAITALKAEIEETKPYPFDAYRGLASSEDRVIYDLIREDMGLSARNGEPAPV